MKKRARKAVATWLMICIGMIFVQVVVGGITRLTGSGLSITEWDFVTGSLPPLDHDHWQSEFDKYRETPQYHKINKGMSLGEFKFIYFWEWIHRFWGRIIGLVIIFPFLYFLARKRIKGTIAWQLAGAVALVGLVGSFGWIMVASGLVNLPWVNPYKLTIHLNLALLLFAYLIWLYLKVRKGRGRYYVEHSPLRKLAATLTIVLVIQLLLGGAMSGMKAAMAYPTWPDMKGAFAPAELFDFSQWTIYNFTHYNDNTFARTFIQFFHRMAAYLVTIMGVVLVFWSLRYAKQPAARLGLFALLGTIILQVILGIITVVSSTAYVPTWLGVVHQAGALLVLAAMVHVNYHLWRNRRTLMAL